MAQYVEKEQHERYCASPARRACETESPHRPERPSEVLVAQNICLIMWAMSPIADTRTSSVQPLSYSLRRK